MGSKEYMFSRIQNNKGTGSGKALWGRCGCLEAGEIRGEAQL